MKLFVCIIPLFFFISSQALARDTCVYLPKPVLTYLHNRQNWKVVDRNSLDDDDRVLWAKYHAGLCPGLAAVKLEKADNFSYSVAIIASYSIRTVEELLLFKWTHSGYKIVTLSSPQDVSSPWVVWRATKGIYHDESSGKNVTIPFDSIIYEKMESTSTQYFESNGKMLSLLASD